MSRKLSRQVSCAKAMTRNCSAQRGCAPGIAGVALDDAREGRPRHELHDLREQGLADVHDHFGVATPGTLVQTAISDSSRRRPLSPEKPRRIGFLTNTSQVNRTVLITILFLYAQRRRRCPPRMTDRPSAGARAVGRHGREGRTTRPFALSCGPSTANGLGYTATANARTDSASSCQECRTCMSITADSGFFFSKPRDETRHAGQRNPDPGGTIGGLIGDLVGGFFNQEQIE